MKTLAASTIGRIGRGIVSSVLVAATAIGLVGCQPNQAAGSGEPGHGAGASVMIDSVNYMHERGVQYTLFDLAKTPPQAIGGAIVVMLASGGEKACCLDLPKVWRPGIKVRLDWQDSDRKQTYPEKYERELEVPRYDAPADLWVVFYPPHEVELVVSAVEPGHPDWPGRIKQGPWEQCVQTYGRKPCKAALPKQFDLRSSQGICTFMANNKLPDADLNCFSAMHDCVRDYEDDVLCKTILWGKPRAE